MYLIDSKELLQNTYTILTIFLYAFILSNLCLKFESDNNLKMRQKIELKKNHFFIIMYIHIKSWKKEGNP